ncbi:hypothetical protein ACIPX0_12320 [Streptomyces sp. NPDC090075]|uniref:hypothetical protein n=1 Tax=Streptomyces sp. NPDC090075 TaxID=3365937 RepID=UPI0038249BBE
MSTNVRAHEGEEIYQWGAQESGLSDLSHTLGTPDGPNSETAGQEAARSALKAALKLAGRAAERGLMSADRTLRRLIAGRNANLDEDDHELRRVVYRLERYEDMTPAAGLPGLRPANGGFSFEDVDGVQLVKIRVRLDGALTFSGLVAKSDSLLSYLALTRGTVVNVGKGFGVDPFRLEPELIAKGMLAVHRQRGGGSMLMIQAGHRADTAAIWIGQHGELRALARAVSEIEARKKAAEQAEQDAKQRREEAQRAAQRAAREGATTALPEPPEPLRRALSAPAKGVKVPGLITAALTEGPATGAALAKRLDRSRSQIYAALARLAAAGDVVQEEHGGPWRLAGHERKSS